MPLYISLKLNKNTFVEAITTCTKCLYISLKLNKNQLRKLNAEIRILALHFS